VSAVPSGVLGLTDKSFLTLSMGFMKDGGRTVWDVQEIRWDRDDAREQAVSVWRRAQPPETARVELRTRYDNIRAHRMPYDGTLNRDTNEVFSATGTIDVAGPTAGSFAGDVQYGLTVYLVGHPTSVEADRSIADLKAATRVLEHGMTKAVAASTTASSTARAEFAPTDTAGFIEQLRENAKTLDAAVVPDLRGRRPSDDIEALLRSTNAHDSAGGRNLPPRQQQQLVWLQSYWREEPALMRNHDLWTQFLSRNHLSADTAHRADVLDAEQQLRKTLGDPITAAWAADAVALKHAYVRERDSLAKRGTGSAFATLEPRSTPCPTIAIPASSSTGSAPPKVLHEGRSLQDLWPAQSRRLGEEGTVLVKIRISAGGCVTAYGIVASSGSEWLDDAVLEYVEAMQFTPAYVNGTPVEKAVSLPVVFTMSDAER
jgi:TonB family protein